MQQFAISQATLFGWNMEGESLCAGSNQGSVAHLSEVNQESITSRGKGLHTVLTEDYNNGCLSAVLPAAVFGTRFTYHILYLRHIT